MNNTIEKLKNHRIEPDDRLWDRLSEKLENDGKVRNLKKYKYLSIAASITAVLCVTSLFFNYFNDSQSTFLSSHFIAEPMQLEDLEDSQNELYLIKNIEILNSAYEIILNSN
jgi:hypothetical protein